MADVYLAQHDLAPSMTATLLAEDGKTAQDLTACTVEFRYQKADGTGPLYGGVCTIIDAAGGEVRFDWLAGETAIPEQYRGEFIVTYPSAKPGTFPNSTYATIQIRPRLVAA